MTFALQVALPALVIVAAAIFAGRIILGDMASQVDRSEARSIQRSIGAALDSYLARLKDTQGDYSVWDDAVTALYGQLDQHFIESNFQVSTQQAKLFDTVYVLDEVDHSVVGYQQGRPAMRSAEDEFGPALNTLILRVRGRPGLYDAVTGYLRDRSGQIFAVAVGSIEPTSAAVPMPLGRPRLLLLGRALDRAALERISSEFVLTGLALAKDGAGETADASGETRGVKIRNPAGTAIGLVTWTPSGEGLAAIRRVLPTAVLAVGLVCLTMLFLMAIGYLSMVKLREREKQASFAANHDGLTGLPNRAALTRSLAAATAAHANAGTPVALIYLDLDGFKEVNDTYGHEAGDFLLKHVAAGFSVICAQAGLLARVGGDEFAVVLDQPRMVAEAEAIADQLIRFFDEPVNINGRLVHLGTSIGVAVALDERISAEELLRRADVAMYLAKEFGRNRVALYDPSIDAARAERLRLADDLREALRANRLLVVYQPIFNAKSMRPVGVEALVRWLHPTIGLVPPDVFVPLAEESGLIDLIGAFVLKRACTEALNWPAVRLSVNVSAVQFRNPDYDRDLAATIDSIGFPAERLEIEMTETHLVANPERAQATIADLRQRGVTIALDDFGTGYSSIGYLRRFTFDKLKLDRSLVIGITGDKTARELCEATIALARALHLEVTAEGVETEREGALLRQAGCDYLQGYAFARPMTAEAMGNFLVATVPTALSGPRAS